MYTILLPVNIFLNILLYIISIIIIIIIVQFVLTHWGRDKMAAT